MLGRETRSRSRRVVSFTEAPEEGGRGDAASTPRSHADCNLITFKSHQEALTDWTLKELTGHYVSYRKLVSPSPQTLLPETDFRMYAVCSRFPHNLSHEVSWQEFQPGVYQCQRGTDLIRVLVTGQLPRKEHNSGLHLYSVSMEQVDYGARHYRQRSPQTSTLLDQLLRGYQEEGVVMSYTMEDFRRDYIMEMFKTLTPEDRRKTLKTLSPDELLEGLSPEAREQLLEKLRAEDAARKSRKRRKK